MTVVRRQFRAGLAGLLIKCLPTRDSLFAARDALLIVCFQRLGRVGIAIISTVLALAIECLAALAVALLGFVAGASFGVDATGLIAFDGDDGARAAMLPR